MKKKMILCFGLVTVLVIFLSGCGKDTQENSYKQGETFSFMGLNLTVEEEYFFADGIGGKTLIKIPMKIENTSNRMNKLKETYISVNGPSGSNIKTDGGMMKKDGITQAEDLREGEFYTKYLYVDYAQDGIYTLVFNDFTSSSIKVEVNIAK